MSDIADIFSKYTLAYERVMLSIEEYRQLVSAHVNALHGKMRVLDSACGPGNLTLELCHPGVRVYAIDANKHALDRLQRRAESKGVSVHTVHGDAHELPFADESFDGVSSMLALPFMQRPLAYLAEHARVLEQSGTLVISGPDIESRDRVDDVLALWKTYNKDGALDKEWQLFEKYTREHVSKNVRNWLSREQVSKMLEQVGFTVTKSCGNPMYLGSGYLIISTKN